MLDKEQIKEGINKLVERYNKFKENQELMQMVVEQLV